MYVAVDEAATIAGNIDPSVNTGIALDEATVVVLVSQIGDGDPCGPLVIGTEKAVDAIDGAGDVDGGIALAGSGHAHAHSIGSGDGGAIDAGPGGAAVGGTIKPRPLAGGQ